MVGREMNANNLADEFVLDNLDWNEDIIRDWGEQAVTMLRQLEKERDELQIECDRLYRIVELNGTLK